MSDEETPSIEDTIRMILRDELERAINPREPEAASDGGKLLYTVTEPASMTGMSSQYVRNDIRGGWLPGSRSGGK